MPRILLLAALTVLTAEAARRPNILVIFSDDHGWADLGANGADKDIRTPELDRLARDGVRFTQGYVTAPQCVPSRAGLMTGRYQQRFGVDDNNKGPLPLEEKTIAERLKAGGYVTGQVGKWHLDLTGSKRGDKGVRLSKDHMPHAQGFDEYFRGELRQFYASHDLQGRPFADAPHAVTDSRFRVEVQTEAALSFLDRRKADAERPWFLYLAWYAPHVPLESPEPWFSRTPAHLPKERRQALAMIAAMDDGLGRIRRKLAEIGADQDTLLFFIGDNGAPLGGAWNGSLNLPMRGQKGMVSEGGNRVPFVAAWPGRIPAGAVHASPVISLDVAATAVAAAGLPADPALDGVDLLPRLNGAAAAPRTLYWRWGSQAAVLEHPHKLVLLGDRTRLLFDVTDPAGESADADLLKQRPEVAAALDRKLKDWAETLKTPGLPTSFDRHHEELFATAGITKATQGVGTPAPDEWICRNGKTERRDGALRIIPEGTRRAFIARTGIDLKGPLTIVLKGASPPGKGAVSWRTEGQSDFLPANAREFEWPADGQETKLMLPVMQKVIHLRLTPPAGGNQAGLRSIRIMGPDGEKAWDFSAR
ncbi:MAG: sulfatase [Opitutales bacterium]